MYQCLCPTLRHILLEQSSFSRNLSPLCSPDCKPIHPSLVKNVGMLGRCCSKTATTVSQSGQSATKIQRRIFFRSFIPYFFLSSQVFISSLISAKLRIHTDYSGGRLYQPLVALLTDNPYLIKLLQISNLWHHLLTLQYKRNLLYHE